ncbi:hypothetical protein NPIL_39631 [Nephila pilipes]|uniref:Uncharacterized protein n=1 Tax=Nephila pilipes TaxID=299642 RepID=A0A8X6QVJ7_NEPPI|nr:hypothetical protein NPIL_39631 [Nephila pilipes]
MTSLRVPHHPDFHGAALSCRTSLVNVRKGGVKRKRCSEAAKACLKRQSTQRKVKYGNGQGKVCAYYGVLLLLFSHGAQARRLRSGKCSAK